VVRPPVSGRRRRPWEELFEELGGDSRIRHRTFAYSHHVDSTLVEVDLLPAEREQLAALWAS